MDKTYQININLDIEMCRLALVGDGYLLEEVKLMSEEKILQIWQCRLETYIANSYYKGRRIGLYEWEVEYESKRIGAKIHNKTQDGN